MLFEIFQHYVNLSIQWLLNLNWRNQNSTYVSLFLYWLFIGFLDVWVISRHSKVFTETVLFFCQLKIIEVGMFCKISTFSMSEALLRWIKMMPFCVSILRLRLWKIRVRCPTLNSWNEWKSHICKGLRRMIRAIRTRVAGLAAATPIFEGFTNACHTNISDHIWEI